MAEKPVQANVTAEKTFSVVCPHCHASKLCQVSDLPPNQPNPFPYACACGVSTPVTLNYRRFPRKRVKLMGTFTVPSEPKKIERICEILDLSDEGARIATDFVKTVAPGNLLVAKIRLDDPQRSKLEVPCIVRNIRRDNLRLMMGLEFVDVDDSQRHALKFYMMSRELELQK